MKYALILVIMFLLSDLSNPYSGQTYQEYIESVRFENYIYYKNPRSKNHPQDVRAFIYHANEKTKRDNMDRYLAWAQAVWEGQCFRKPNHLTIGKLGEKTYYQFMKRTAKGLGYTFKDLNSIEKTVEARNKHFKYCLKVAKGNKRKALQIYNGGLGHYRSYQAIKYAKIVLNLREEIIKHIKGS